MLKFAKRKLKW